MKVHANPKRSVFYLIFLIVNILNVEAQPRVELVNIVISPDHDNWTYQVGEQAIFNVNVYKYGIPLADINVRYEIRPEKLDAVKEGTLQLKKKGATIKPGTSSIAGYFPSFLGLQSIP